jgi:hypothetical protein
MKENSSKSVAVAFHRFMVLNGVPASVSTDGGPEFQGVGIKDSFADLCSFYDIERITLRSYPRFIDRFIRTIRDMINIRRETRGSMTSLAGLRCCHRSCRTTMECWIMAATRGTLLARRGLRQGPFWPVSPKVGRKVC